MNSDDSILKAWRNSNALDDPVSDLKSSKSGQFQKQSHVDQFSQQSDSIQIKEESFSISVYILLILTLFVITLFLNYCRKKRRRKYFLFL